jgi:hypothetical protein
MALVYRIERMGGSGPYRSGTWKDNLFPDHMGRRDGHPTPWDWDEPWGAYEGWSSHEEWEILNYHVFGFLDTTQLHNWFSPEECRLLRKHKFICASYEVPDDYVEMGESQCSFDIGKAKRVKIQKIW